MQLDNDSIFGQLVRSALRQFKELYATLVGAGLATHSVAFGLTMMLVPNRSAVEMNPIASSVGLVHYFPITLGILCLTYYWIWKSKSISGLVKILVVSAITGVSVFDCAFDLGTFIRAVGNGALF